MMSTNETFHFRPKGEDEQEDEGHRVVTRFIVKGLESEPRFNKNLIP